MAQLYNLPAYEFKNALVNFAPINDAIDSNRQNALMQRRADNEDQRLGMERERLGMAKQEHGERANQRKVQAWGAQAQVIDEMPDGPQKQELAGRFYASNPDLIAHSKSKGIDPQHPTFWKMLRAEAGNYDPLKQRQVEAQIDASKANTAQSYAATAATNAQAQQLSRQTPEARASVAGEYGLVKGTPEYNQFVISGQYAPKSNVVNVKDSERPYEVGRDPATGKTVYTPIDTGTAREGISDPKDKASVEHQLRQEINSVTKDYRTVREALGSLEKIAEVNSAGSDIALIFSYMKILDPNSVVRETEFATAQNAAGVPDQVRNMFNRALNGERLNPTQRQDFLGVARRVGESQIGQYTRTINQYQGVAQRSGVNPRNVILDQELIAKDGKISPGNTMRGQAPPPASSAMAEAKAAIAAGAPRDKVIERLRQNGMPTDGL
jgi:hypothetical protein